MTRAPIRGADRASHRFRQHRDPAPEKRAAVITPEQLGQMLAIAQPRDAALLAVMAAGACRIGEALQLIWSDIDAAGRVVIPGSCTKSGASRAFALPSQARAYLDAWQAICPPTTSGWLFPGQPARQPLSIRAGQAAISKLAQSAGIDGVSSHSLRRSALTAAHQAGLPLRALAELSGHRSMASLQRYLDEDQARLAADQARGLLFGQR